MDVDPDVLTEVPPALKRLVRYMMRGFYTPEHVIVADMLMHHPCIKEDDLLDLIKFERKQLRAVVNSLKQDHFIKTRLRVETDAEGRTTKHNFYFLCYSVLVNVIKYKLNHMRHRIETEERDLTNRARFICGECQTEFTDLEVGLLMNMYTGQLICTFCGTEIVEDSAVRSGAGTDGLEGASVDPRTRMIKFNDETAPLYALLHSVEDVKLSASILEPEPKDMKSSRSGGSSRGPGQGWSGDSTRNGVISYESTVTITTGEAAEANISDKPKKAAPIWMSQSTIQEAFVGNGEKNPDNKPHTSSSKSDKPTSSKTDRQTSLSKSDAAGTSNRQTDDDIMRTLLQTESKKKQEKSLAAQSSGASSSWGKAGQDGASPWGSAGPGGSTAYDESSSSDSEGEEGNSHPPATQKQVPPPLLQSDSADVEMGDDDDDEEEEEAVVMVTVAGVQHPYGDVTDAMVERMSVAEKNEYVRLGQKLYEDMFD